MLQVDTGRNCMGDSNQSSYFYSERIVKEDRKGLTDWLALWKDVKVASFDKDANGGLKGG